MKDFDRQPVLCGELLKLRPLRADDFDALYAAAADPLIWEQHPEPDRWTAPGFQRYFDAALASGGALVVLERASGRVIGSSRFHGYDAEQRSIEIGWTFLARSYWGGPYNAELKRLMLEHAFGCVDRVLFRIGAGNLRSRGAVEKLGAQFAGDEVKADGQPGVVYQLFKEDWFAALNVGSHSS